MDYELIFNGDLQEMAADEIINHVDPATYNQIKRVDKKPLFKVFSLGHEGESEGKVLGIGTVVKKWVKSVIQMMHDKLKIGTKVFLHHSKDNTHSGRLQLGKLVGKAIETLQNGLNAIGIIYINPEHRELKTDVASIEAGFSWNPINKEIKGISDITGIALGNSDNMQPGFKGAILQAQLQEFHDSHIKDGIGVKMTLTEIKKAIEEGGHKPLDCFGRDVIEQVDFVDDRRQANKRLYEKTQKMEDAVENTKKMKTEYEEKITKLNTTIGDYKTADTKRDSVKVLDAILKERTTLQPEQIDFIKMGYKEFKITDPEKVKEELNGFADKRLDELKVISKDIFKIETEDNKDDDKGKGPQFTKSPAGKFEKDENGLIKGENRFYPTQTK